jgi:hypothetical protein
MVVRWVVGGCGSSSGRQRKGGSEGRESQRTLVAGLSFAEGDASLIDGGDRFLPV